MITMKHKLAYIPAKALRSHFIEILMILTKYVFDVNVRLTEYYVTVESGSTVLKEKKSSILTRLFMNVSECRCWKI